MSAILENSREAKEANAFAEHTGITVTELRQDYAEASLEITPQTMNLYGLVHGGALFTLADVCAGMTARTDGRTYVTQQASVQFLRSAQAGRLVARGKVLHRGGTICLIQVEITDEAGKMLMISTFNFYCLRR
ncbi:MAG: PaaI family thioesterase [Gemmiger sp.]